MPLTRLLDYGVLGTILVIILLSLWRFAAWVFPLLENIAKAYQSNVEAISLDMHQQTKILEQNSAKMDAANGGISRVNTVLDQHTNSLAEIHKTISREQK